MPESDDTTTIPTWVWPSNEEINDFPDPLGFDREWTATLAEGPSVHAEIFAREYVQSSWDSIEEQVARLEAKGVDVPDQIVEFQFVRLHCEATRHFLDVFSPPGHRKRYADMSATHRSGQRSD